MYFCTQFVVILCIMSPLGNYIVNLWENESEKGKWHLSIYYENNFDLVTLEKVLVKPLNFCITF